MPYSNTDFSSDTSGIRYDPPEPTTAWVTTEMPETRVEVQAMGTAQVRQEGTIATDDHIVYYTMNDYNCGHVTIEKPHRTVKQLLEEKDWEL